MIRVRFLLASVLVKGIRYNMYSSEEQIHIRIFHQSAVNLDKFKEHEKIAGVRIHKYNLIPKLKQLIHMYSQKKYDPNEIVTY